MNHKVKDKKTNLFRVALPKGVLFAQDLDRPFKDFEVELPQCSDLRSERHFNKF